MADFAHYSTKNHADDNGKGDSVPGDDDYDDDYFATGCNSQDDIK
jgi:hypothetical protein